MPRSNATTVAQYLKELPDDRRKVVAKVRDVVRNNLPTGYEESLLWGMITYAVPMSALPETYNQQPLCYVALAAQKNYYALYLMSVAGTDVAFARNFRDGYVKSGKTLDMGKSCVRFKTIDDLPLDLIGRTIAAIPMDKWIAIYKASRTQTTGKTTKTKAVKKKRRQLTDSSI